MVFNPKIHHRKTTRIASHDYASKSDYFITLNCLNRVKYFGKVEDGVMIPGEIGSMAEKFWLEIPEHFPFIVLHEFQVMPEHFHGIIEHKGIPANSNPRKNQFGKPISGSISTIINQYKGTLKRWCNQNGFEEFQWQSRFYEHIVRNAHEFKIISLYISDNPKNYGRDRFPKGFT